MSDTETTQPQTRTAKSDWTSKRTMAVVFGGLAVIVGGSWLIHQGDGPSSGSTGSTGTLPSTHTVLYEVEGSTTQASITISTSGGETSQASDIDVPMQTKDGGTGLTGTFRSGEFLYLSAQNSHDSGTITCRITVDGVVVSEVTSQGGYTIATCKGTA